jgi:predicted metal-binding membrane protein
LAVLGLLVVLTISAWALTVHQARTMDMPMGIVARGGAAPGDSVPATGNRADMDDMVMEETASNGMQTVASSGMAGMVEAGWSWAGFATFLFAWAVMMVAMMFPAAAPMLLLYHKINAQRRARSGAFVPTWVFGSGYLLVWTAVGAAMWVLVRLGSELANALDTGSRATWAPIALGATLGVAGLYQLTPLKTVCLDHCRTPLGFVTQHWRDGYPGALRMGLVHGGYCLGCCWALFAVLVAAGVMSLAWMALLTLVIFAEKVLPLGRHASTGVGVALLALGIIVATGAAGLPWIA